MKNIILTITAATFCLTLTSCVGVALWGADKGSQAMAEEDNETVRKTGQTIQRGLAPINEAKDKAVDAVKEAVD